MSYCYLTFAIIIVILLGTRSGTEQIFNKRHSLFESHFCHQVTLRPRKMHPPPTKGASASDFEGSEDSSANSACSLQWVSEPVTLLTPQLKDLRWQWCGKATWTYWGCKAHVSRCRSGCESSQLRSDRNNQGGHRIEASWVLQERHVAYGFQTQFTLWLSGSLPKWHPTNHVHVIPPVLTRSMGSVLSPPQVLKWRNVSRTSRLSYVECPSRSGVVLPGSEVALVTDWACTCTIVLSSVSSPGRWRCRRSWGVLVL